jgi:hypothetical protein
MIIRKYEIDTYENNLKYKNIYFCIPNLVYGLKFYGYSKPYNSKDNEFNSFFNGLAYYTLKSINCGFSFHIESQDHFDRIFFNTIKVVNIDKDF